MSRCGFGIAFPHSQTAGQVDAKVGNHALGSHRALVVEELAHAGHAEVHPAE